MKGNSLLPERKGENSNAPLSGESQCISGFFSAPFLKHRQKRVQNLIINTKQL